MSDDIRRILDACTGVTVDALARSLNARREDVYEVLVRMEADGEAGFRRDRCHKVAEWFAKPPLPRIQPREAAQPKEVSCV